MERKVRLTDISSINEKKEGLAEEIEHFLQKSLKKVDDVLYFRFSKQGFGERIQISRQSKCFYEFGNHQSEG